MSRCVDVVVESPVSVTEFHSALREEHYWQARLAALRPGTTVDSFNVERDGTVTVVTTEDLAHQALPSVIAKVYPGDLTISGSQTWSFTGEGRVCGQVNLSAVGSLGRCRGQAVLAPTRDGSQLKFTATVQVKVPLVGGKIESYIGSQLAEEVHAIAGFTTEWITQRGSH